jgi:hypothetical protein
LVVVGCCCCCCWLKEGVSERETHMLLLPLLLPFN